MLAGYFAQGIQHHPSVVLAVVFAFCTAYAQRVLSTRARYLRRKVGHATTFLEMDDGQVTRAGKDWELEPLDRALAWLSVAMVVLAGAMVLWRAMA